MKKLLLIPVLFIMVSCSHIQETSCYQKVSASETAISGTYDRVITLVGSNIINLEDGRKAYQAIKIADTFTNNAGDLCGVDDAQAEEYIVQASEALTEALSYLGE